MANTISSFTAGDLVVSVYGDGDGSGTYADNQASPITLEELSTSGAVAGQLVLPQTASGANQVFSGEYGSSSEGSLELSGDGQSLSIAGYRVNAAAFNSGGVATYGTTALAQSTSVPGGTYTAVARAVADIRFDGTIDTSTAAFNIDNTNNPRSVVTQNGSVFYVAGQGVKGDKTQGLFELQDGSTTTTPTAINTSTDMRTAEIYNGNLYVSTDSKQGPTANIAEYAGLPTGASTPKILPGISQSVTLGAGQGNAINSSSGSVNLSPENFFFADPNTLYVADGGQPKAGGVGDGGLQKWSFANGSWKLDYTLSAGLSLVNGTSASSGTTGLIGLTGKVNGDGTVSLYATNSTVGDTDPTYLYGITDTASATSLPASESFQTLLTAAPDTNIRGVAFAPQAVTCFATGTAIRTARGDVAVERLEVGDLAVTAGGALRPIRWIGHRRITREGGLDFETQPICVHSGAFGVGLPSRDLRLSPGHPVLVGADEDGAGGHLVPVMCLVNGTTVRREAVAHVTYWHVELDAHDILLAEGLPAESYLDWGDRTFFTEGADHALINPDFVVVGLAARCRPVAIDGGVVEGERRRLDRIFASRLDTACAWPSAVAFGL